MVLIVIKQAERELKKIPKEFILDIYSLIDELLQGRTLSMPNSRSLNSIAPGLHELRLSGRSGELRLFYYLKIENRIYVLHVMQKKNQIMSKETINLLKIRIRSLL